jgi:hypothetical protein
LVQGKNEWNDIKEIDEFVERLKKNEVHLRLPKAFALRERHWTSGTCSSLPAALAIPCATR